MKNMFKDYQDRRHFMANAAKACFGVGLLPYMSNDLFAAQTVKRPTAKNVIYLYLSGGMSHLDSFDPKDNSEVKGKTEKLKGAEGIRVSNFMPYTAKQLDKVAIIRSMTTTQGAHQQGNYYMHCSYTMRGTIRHPGLGAWIMKLSGKENNTIPGSVCVNGGSNVTGAGFMESRYQPLLINNPEEGLRNSKILRSVNRSEFNRQMELSKALDANFHAKYNQKEVRAYKAMYNDAIKLMDSKDLEAFDLKKETAKIRETYGNGKFGQGCLLARRLIENGVRFVEVVSGGWDHHNNLYENFEERMAEFDKAYAALLADLDSRGMLEETIVVVATEFGRTPKFNVNQGRDHFPRSFSCSLAGGGIQGGQVYGSTDDKGEFIKSNKVGVEDFNATVAFALGLPLQQIIFSPSKRPFKVANNGKPLLNLFS